jgi:hypothetical protein
MSMAGEKQVTKSLGILISWIPDSFQLQAQVSCAVPLFLNAATKVSLTGT